MTNAEFHYTGVTQVDMDRCFMPAEENDRLDIEGCGELPVPGAHLLVPIINRIVEVALDHNVPVAETSEAHPEETAHFSDNPDFVNTWPKHGVQGTPGAMLHPGLVTAHDPRVAHFVKGDIAARTPEEDNSYTGALAHRTHPETGADQLLPEYYRENGVRRIHLLGVTESKSRHLCVGETALDLLKQGFEVTIVTDAVATLEPEAHDECMDRLGKLGMELVTSHQVVAELAATPEVVR